MSQIQGGVTARIKQFEQIAIKHAEAQGVLAGRKVAMGAKEPKVTSTVLPQLQAKSEPKTEQTPRHDFSKLSAEDKRLLQDVVDDIIFATLEVKLESVVIEEQPTVLSSPLEIKTEINQREIIIPARNKEINLEELTLWDKVDNRAGGYSQLAAIKQESPENLYAKIAENREKTAQNLENGKRLIQEFPYSEGRGRDKLEDEAMRHTIEDFVSKGAPLKLLSGGLGGARLVRDPTGMSSTSYIIKANDEDVHCMNNPKMTAMVLGAARDTVESGREAEASALAYDIARTIGMADVTPQATMVVLTSNDFHDILDSTQDAMNPDSIQKTGPAVREKLCSVQKFEPNTESLLDITLRLEDADVDEDAITEQICSMVQPESFQKCYIFSMLLGENDGNMDNIRLKTDPNNKDGQKIMFKVDNGLALPEYNTGISTCLSFYDDLMDTPLTDTMKTTIESISEEAIVTKMQAMGKSDASIKATIQRIFVMKECIKQLEEPTSADIKDAIKILERGGSLNWKFSEIRQKLEVLFEDSQQVEQAETQKSSVQESSVAYSSVVDATDDGAPSTSSIMYSSVVEEGEQ